VRCGGFGGWEVVVAGGRVRLSGRWVILADALPDVVRRGGMMRIAVRGCDDLVVVAINRS
jgi:hypothetical protein